MGSSEQASSDVSGHEAEYVPSPSARAVEIGGPTLTLQSPGTLVVRDHPRPSMTTRIGISASGNPWLRIASVSIDADGRDEVSTEDLRSVRVIELVRLHLPSQAGGSAFTSHFRDSEEFGSAIRDQWPSEGAMRELARTYNVARALRLHPIKAVTESFGVSRSTAHRWVNQCREAGMIADG